MCDISSFRVPRRPNTKCPDCLEPSLTVSEAEVTLSPDGETGLAYTAICSSCGFTVQRDESYGVPLRVMLNTLLMMDVRLALNDPDHVRPATRGAA